MIVYLDTSALNRVFDDQGQPRIYMEASSMLLVFGLIEKRIITIASSDALLYENGRNPYQERRLFVAEVLRKARIHKTLDDVVNVRARAIEGMGIKGLDALHLACAEQLNASYFVTCDDRIIRKYRGEVSVLNPVEFTMRMFRDEESGHVDS